MKRSAWPAMLILPLLTLSTTAQQPLEQRVNQTIEKMQQHFFKTQSQNGTWSHHGTAKDGKRDHGGETSLVVYALMESGAHAQDPRIQKSLKYLSGLNIKGTYARGIRNHVWAALPDSYRSQMAADTEWLYAAGKDGNFHYVQDANGWDNSVTQYGVLGIWEAAKRGADIPDQFWQRVMKHFFSTQNGENGGWGYKGGDNPRGSMTAAGLTAQYIVLEELFRDRGSPPDKLQQSIRRGLHWLDNNFKPGNNPGYGRFWPYYIYGIERVGLASGVRYLNGRDWFKAGAQEVIRRANNKGSLGSPHKTAFGLLFLARGKVPVWINKLALPEQTWNRRPNDLFFLTKYLSGYSERKLNWLRAPIDSDPREWLNAPLLYFSSDEAPELSEPQRKKIKRYIELGGTLVINPESRAVGNFGSELAKKLFPDYPLKGIGRNHPLTDLVREAPEASSIQHVSNGARDLILILPDDWGMAWQADTGSERQSLAWKAGVNLFALATGRGRIGGRLRDPLVPDQGGGQTQISMIRAKYDGNWNPEPAAMDQTSQFMANQTGMSLSTETKPLEQIGDSNAPIVHLAGVQQKTLTDAQLQAVKSYVQDGGTVLVETVGGQGGFAVNIGEPGIQAQLVKALGASGAPPIGAGSTIVTGNGLSKGFNLQQIGFRPYSVVTTGASGPPQLSAIFVDNRPAVLISAEDISLGCLGVPRWNINGYKPEGARKLMTNIVLYANQN
jgi:hypothetical protein